MLLTQPCRRNIWGACVFMPQLCRRRKAVKPVLIRKKRGAEAPRSGVGSRVGLLNDFAMKVDIRTFDFGFFLDPQADDQVDNLQDDG